MSESLSIDYHWFLDSFVWATGMKHGRQGMVRFLDLSYVKVCQISCRNLVLWAGGEHILSTDWTHLNLRYFYILYVIGSVLVVEWHAVFHFKSIPMYVLRVFTTWSFKSSSHPCAAQQGEYSILKMWTRLDHVEWRRERVWNGRHVVGAGDNPTSTCPFVYAFTAARCSHLCGEILGQMQLPKAHFLDGMCVCHSESNLSCFLYSRCHHNHHLLLLL